MSKGKEEGEGVKGRSKGKEEGEGGRGRRKKKVNFPSINTWQN